MNYNNQDYVERYAAGSSPIGGVYTANGSPIDSFYIDPDTKKKVYPNYRQRAWFFTQVQLDDIGARLSKDIGDVFGGFEFSDFFDTSKDLLGRRFAYALIAGNQITLSGIFEMMTNGKDLQGRVLYDEKEYKLGVGAPGKFSYSEQGGLQYTPERK